MHAQLFVGLGGQQHDRNRIQLAPRPDLSQQRLAAHDRHHDVAHDEVGRAVERARQPLASVVRADEPVLVPETLTDELQHLAVVLHDQDRRPIGLELGRRLLLTLDRRPQLLDSLLRGFGQYRPRRGDHAAMRSQRHVDLEQRAAFGGLRDGDRAAVKADEVARDGQAQTRAAKTAVRAALQLAESFEHRLPVRERNSRAAVRDLQDDPLRRPGFDAHGTAHGAAGGRELEGVRDQIEQDALNLVGVADSEHTFGRIHRVSDPPFSREHVEVAGHDAEELRQIDLRVVERHLPRFQLRDVEQIVDVLEQRAPVTHHDLEVRSDRGRDVLGLEQPGRRAQDQRQRRA